MVNGDNLPHPRYCSFPSYPGSLGTSAGEPLATISWFWDSIAVRGARLLVVVVVARLSRARGGSDGARRSLLASGVLVLS